MPADNWMLGSAATVPACARAVIWPAHPRRAHRCRAGCPGGRERHSWWQSGAAECV